MASNPSQSKIQLAPWIAVFLTIVATAFLLRAEGRLWICSCGQVALWSGAVCSANNSQQFLDPYSFTHVLHGFLYFWLITLLFQRFAASWRFWLAVAVGAAWEVFENTEFVIQRYRVETAQLGYQGDTVLNALGDMLCAILGYLLAKQLGWLRSLVVFVVLELVLLLWIKDSLLLEILMLIYPVDAIKMWQMCR